LKNGRYCDAQIMAVLKQAEAGLPVIELGREHGMSSASFYKWRAKFGGIDASLISESEPLSAIDGMDGSRFRHRNVPHWVL